jgi:acetyl-CoA acetyltransferase
MTAALLCSMTRTPFGRYGGALAGMRTDDLAALPITALMKRHSSLDWARVDEVILGCANQSGEDNRNVARMAALLAGLPESVPAFRSIACARRVSGRWRGSARNHLRRGQLVLAGGVEHVARTVCHGQARHRVPAQAEARRYDARLAHGQSACRPVTASTR